jgi:hypothetical protein
MTKLEEQELYYERLLDNICAMDESSGIAYLSKLDEKTAQGVMKAMIKKVDKNLNKAEKAIGKIKNKVAKANDATLSRVRSKGLIEAMEKVSKNITDFRADYLSGTEGEHIWVKMMEGTAKLSPEQQDAVNGLTQKDLKQYQKDGEYEAKAGIARQA